MARVRVAVKAFDRITHIGLVKSLGGHPGVLVVPDAESGDAQVLVMAADRLSYDVVARLRSGAEESDTPVVLVADQLDDAELLVAIECRVVAVLPTATATGEQLARAVSAAAGGGGVLPPSLVGKVLKHVERLQREVLTAHGAAPARLSEREIDVLRLVADGRNTVEIARELCYSARTVKNIVASVTGKLNLRNRAHAVAYAARAGII
ncbi:helix-turn-helix transcriptional regulator [Saccharothrix yanglingensis]|uniref:Helix-turn-helix transcriptional regulator n=1 Tax=Saccharothrix yanglingensis TaxID=659496 RepID=A0ABU0XBV7_9PSEU|nr:LuxR C-terminal-related transcriptional regulator [Saccharothrix yanglingensis]MDQ2589112.1 helix-turn-helix transcriptional regulator [Saccharothrix yanglingensis]